MMIPSYLSRISPAMLAGLLVLAGATHSMACSGSDYTDSSLDTAAAAALGERHDASTAAAPLPEPASFDHSAFDKLLSRAVSNGLVNYKIFKDNASFSNYLTALGSASPKSLSTDERLAFWINAYNAMVIRNVLDHPGMKKPTDVAGFFDKITFRVAGRSLTLNAIENDIIRKEFSEPLIHFGLVCAARSCPPLIPTAYTGNNVRRLLARNAESYLASDQNSYDAKRNRLTLSKIFDWYKEDFGGDAGLREFAGTYGTSAMKKNITSGTSISFREYDWTINAG